jgi:hypothetical protein
MKKPFAKKPHRILKQPVQPGRKIYTAPCKKCGGKGRIKEAAN